jgi:L-lactate dehydrogenase complex protein LldG
MSASRDEILGRVRAAKKNMIAETDFTAAHKRIQEHAPNLIPKRGSLELEERIKLFQNEAEKVNASVIRIQKGDSIPSEVARFLKEHNLPPKIKLSPKLKDLPWKTTLVETEAGIAHGDDAVSVTAVFAGVAETGTLITFSGPETPTTLNFLPLTNIAVLEASQIYGNYEHVFNALRNRQRENNKADDFMPRTLNFITGPSRSADIEQTLLLGAHGPQRLHIIVVDDELS